MIRPNMSLNCFYGSLFWHGYNKRRSCRNIYKPTREGRPVVAPPTFCVPEVNKTQSAGQIDRSTVERTVNVLRPWPFKRIQDAGNLNPLAFYP